MIKTKLIPRTESAYDSPLLIKTLLQQSLRYFPDREIVYRNLFRMNYFELNSRINRLANALTDIGLQPGETVGVLDWDSHRYLECYFAIPAMGAILHTVNVRLSPAQILFTINHAEDKVILIHEDFLPIIEAIKAQFTTVEKYIVISDKVYTDPNAELAVAPFTAEGEYESLLSKANDQYEFPDFDENTWATIFYTTGTTGDPKGVYFSHRQLFLHTVGLVSYFCGYEALPYNNRDVYMPITPMFHVHAWGFPFVATMLNNKQVYPGRYEPEMLLKLLITEKVTLSHCVPTILNMLVNSPVARQVDLTQWKVVIGGGALTRGLAKAAMELGINVTQGYGMSETAPVMAVVHLNDEQRKLPLEDQLDFRAKTGKVAPFVEIRIIDEEGNFLPHDGHTTGEIVTRSPWMTQGYFKDPESSEKLWKGNWLHTGDVASMDASHFVMISDRVKDVIKTGGEWISSLDIENIISQIEGVSEVAVVGVPHEKWGERPHALVVLKAVFSEQLTPEVITEKVACWVQNGALNKWYVPDKIHIVTEIPKTGIGKIDKKRIRAELKL
jgi:fatty-acyl-CoA synthase